MATYNFTVRAQDETGAFSDRDFSIQVRNNLVDRLLAVNNTDAYASVDGSEWVERTGKGGIWCKHFLNKWIIAVDDTTYRISNDTINWQEGLEFKLSNNPPTYDTDGETILEPAGTLYDMPFEINIETMVEMSGRIVGLTYVDNKLSVVYSTDLAKWYVYESSVDGHESNRMGISENIFGTVDNYGNIYSNWRGMSNIVIHNDKYTMFNHFTQNFYVSENLIDWEVVEVINKVDFNGLELPFRRESTTTSVSITLRREAFINLISVNSVLILMANMNRYIANSTNRMLGESSSSIYYTINLSNVSYGTDNQQTYYTSSSSSRLSRSLLDQYPAENLNYSSFMTSMENRNIIYSNGYIYAWSGKNAFVIEVPTANSIDVAYNSTNSNYIPTSFTLFNGKVHITSVYGYVRATDSTSGFSVKPRYSGTSEGQLPSATYMASM